MSNKFMLSQIMTDAEDAIRAVINDTYICDYGIVKEVKDGVVAVEISVATENNDIRILTCVLAGIASSSVCVNVVPKAGDKVIVFYPRRYSVDMFDTDKDEVIVEERSEGYNAFKGIAFLANQAKTDYKNRVTVEDGKLDISLAYDKNNESNLLTLSSNEKGEIEFESNKVKFKTTDGLISIEDTNGVKFTTNSDGYFSISDKNGKKVESNGNGILVNSHLLVK